MPVFECLKWSSDSYLRCQRRVSSIECIYDHKTQKISVHFSFIGVGVDLESVGFNGTIESFYHTVGLWGIWLGEPMVNPVCFTYEIESSLESSFLISFVIIEGIFLPIICEDFTNMEWKECNGSLKKCCGSTRLLIFM